MENKKYHDFFESNHFYHLYNRGVESRSIFMSERNYIFFLAQFQKYLLDYLNVYAYCLLPNHFHFLIQVKENIVNEQLENQFMLFFRSYALAFNKQEKRTGALFQKGFKRIEVDSDAYLSKIIHYIHNNPIHHQYVKTYEEWKFSSFNAMMSDKKTLLERDFVLNWFGGKEDFLKFHMEMIDYGEFRHLLAE